MGEAWIIDAVRTPRGKGKKESGALAGTHPQELPGQCLHALKDRQGFAPPTSKTWSPASTPGSTPASTPASRR